MALPAGPRRGRRTGLAPAAAAAAVFLAARGVLSFVSGAPFGAGGGALRSGVRLGRAGASALQAQVSVGHCLQKDGTWKLADEGVPIEGPEEDAQALKSWKIFRSQYTSAADRGMYMDTPVAEEDIKYRWRRLRNNFGLSSEEALKIIEVDALPLVVDSDYVKSTFDAMVEGASREKALQIVMRHPGILVAGKAVKDNMIQADITSTLISLTRPLAALFSGNKKVED